MIDYDFANEKLLVKEAKLAGVWIYNPDTKTWWTPEEFEEIFINNCSGDIPYSQRKWVHDLKIRDPRDASIDFLLYFKKVFDKAENHTRKVKEYYKNNPQYIKV